MKFRDFIQAVISGLQLPWYQRLIPVLMRATERSLEAQSKLADSIDANAVHGSDGPDTAKNEIAYFFPSLNGYSR